MGKKVHLFCSVAEGTKPADEPKFVIFYNMLVAIFQLFCFHCKWEKPSVEVYQIGTLANVTQNCNHCGRVYKWKSQPSMFTKHPAGNVMMSFGIMVSGAKISQTLLMFRHMGLSATLLEPTIIIRRSFTSPRCCTIGKVIRPPFLIK